MKKTKDFLTGSTGTMGFAAFKEPYERRHMYDIILLNRGSKKNKETFKNYKYDKSVKIVWGDLMNYEDVLGRRDFG